MNAAPAWLRAQVRWHNIHAVSLALLSLATAALAWILAYFFFTLILLGLVTADRGDFGPQIPWWISGTGMACTAVLLIWGVIDHARHRYDGPSDRAVIGWHLFGEFLLLPVRLTFAIWGNLTAIRRLNDEELARAWELLGTIQRHGKTHLSALTLIEPDVDRLYRLLTTLQMLGLIDLHRGEGDWFYTVSSPRMDELRKLLAAPE
jgi:hypothetical protein